jgi:ABC-type polysaccharide/polyol phosphate transport system ATPase subunit
MIVDEVLAVDDAECQKRCLGKMKQISEGRADGVLSEPQLAAVCGPCFKGILPRMARATGSIQSLQAREDVLSRDYSQEAVDLT